MVIILCIFDMNILCDHIYNLIYIYNINIYTYYTRLHNYQNHGEVACAKALGLKPW